MSSGWCDNRVTRQHARCNNKNKRLLEKIGIKTGRKFVLMNDTNSWYRRKEE